jgi:hypothetical protein
MNSYQLGIQFMAEDGDEAIKIVESWTLSEGVNILGMSEIPLTVFGGLPQTIEKSGHVEHVEEVTIEEQRERADAEMAERLAGHLNRR